MSELLAFLSDSSEKIIHVSVNFIGSHSSSLFSLFSPAFLNPSDIDLCYVSLTSLSLYMPPNGAGCTRNFFSHPCHFFLNCFTKGHNFFCPAWYEMEKIDIVLSFPALQSLSHPITVFLISLFLKLKAPVHLANRKLELFYKTVQFQMSFQS